MNRAAVLVLAVVSGCAADTRRFPLRSPLWHDTDLESRSVPCRPDKPGKDGKPRVACRPDEYESSFMWDGADNLVFRQVARFFAVDPGREAVNVNAYDEVPDSAWFTNRMGRAHLERQDLLRGACGDEPVDVDLPDGAVVIDQGKANGANPGFRIRLPSGQKYMLKADGVGDDERATGATAMATRLYYAAGWFTACDTVVYIRPAALKLTPGLTVTDNHGTTRPFDDKALEHLLSIAAHRGDRVRFAASRWLPGRTIGPFTYVGRRDDDPNDIIPHEDRRDLRGARLLAAWVNHYDSREQNSLDTWIADDPRAPDSSPGKVVHHYIDLGDCFGGSWDPDSLWRRIGRSYFFDVADVLADLFSFGLVERSWDKLHKPPTSIFGYYTTEEFNPDGWKGLYPNPAFIRMTELDGAWVTRIIARFTDGDLEAIGATGEFTDPEQTRMVVRAMIGRRDIIMRRYLSRVSPVTDLAVDGDTLCGVDLARKSGVFGDRQRFAYAATIGGRPAPAVDVQGEGRVCLRLPHAAALAAKPDADPARYLVVELVNGQAAGALRAHLYDLGPERGFALAGIERTAGSP